MALMQTPLHSLHVALGARMVEFAGYDMPVQYPEGIIAEHLHTRKQAGLFDVSHMGQMIVAGPEAATELEALMPADLTGLPAMHSTYTLLTSDSAGVLDDLIVTRLADDRFMLVVNADCKQNDFALVSAGCQSSTVTLHEDRALLALQGPLARDVICRVAPDVSGLVFMTAHETVIADCTCFVTCSGYTGEDGFEISMAAQDAETIARTLLAESEVKPVGLGARDSLRLEAGLCLYGHELDPEVTPIDAGLAWAIARSRRQGGAREGGYPGSDVVAGQMAAGVPRKRVGLIVDGKRPIRAGQTLTNTEGDEVGVVTSGGFGPSVDAPVAMAYVDTAHADIDTELVAEIRGKTLNVRVARLPMTKPGYHRG